MHCTTITLAGLYLEETCSSKDSKASTISIDVAPLHTVRMGWRRKSLLAIVDKYGVRIDQCDSLYQALLEVYAFYYGSH